MPRIDTLVRLSVSGESRSLGYMGLELLWHQLHGSNGTSLLIGVLASAVFALKAGVWFWHGHLAMLSPVRGTQVEARLKFHLS